MYIKGVRVWGYRCHEDGDQSSIPRLLFCDGLLDPQQGNEQLPQLHHALAVSRPRRPHVTHELHDPPMSRSRAGTVGQGHKVLSREGRVLTFAHDWQGPPPQTMAEAGFYQDQASVVCPFCPVTFRSKGWQSEEDPWERHVNLSSNCRLVRLVGMMGKRKFRHSCTSLHILGRH